MLLNIIRQTINEYNLFDKGDRVLIGLSGGADSVCLTHALNALSEELGIELFTAHLNHGIRGEEAQRDERFAAEFSESLGLKCFVKKTNIPLIAMGMSLSEETAARQVRYDFFETLANSNSIDKIATAHNKNDNAETILMNFMRGGSLSGLCGIPYKRGNIVRPLLNASRNDIEKYCQDNKLSFVTDSTNLKNDYTRNKIRNTLIPQIERTFNSNFVGTVTDNAQIIREDNELLDKLTNDVYDEVVSDNTVDIAAFRSHSAAIRRRIIRKLLHSFFKTSDGITAQTVNNIMTLSENNSGKSINILRETRVKNEYGKLIITSDKACDVSYYEYRVKIGGECEIREIGKRAVVRETDSREKNGSLYLDANNADEIVIRSKKSGDTFYPSGLNGSKKVKEYFINSKIPKEERGKIPIVEIDGRIAAVGKRADERFLFKDNGIKIDFYDI